MDYAEPPRTKLDGVPPRHNRTNTPVHVMLITVFCNYTALRVF